MPVQPSAKSDLRGARADSGFIRPEGWLRDYQRRALGYDATAVIGSGLAALLLRFGPNDPALQKGWSYTGIALLVAAAWLLVLAFNRCYEKRYLAFGTLEYRRVASASVRLAGVAGFVAYATKTEPARGFLLLYFPLGLLSLMTGRWLLRARLNRERQAGMSYHRTVVVGGTAHVRELVDHLAKDRENGFRVVGLCLSDHDASDVPEDLDGLPVIGPLENVRAAVELLGADTVAITASPGLDGESLRQLGYEFEGSGIDLLVVPTLMNVVGSRIHIRPVAGSPLLHVNEPEFGGARKALKSAFDRVTAALALALLTPVLFAVALAIRLTSRGPALFTQTRVGRDGQLFSVYKFRTMVVDAEAQLAALAKQNEYAGGVLFKMKDDPRITGMGAFLRKYSLDELPQLINVLMGHMSMVGPRPPLPTEVEKYEGHAHRRLLVKPGITGLWQVSGRSDLSWDDTVRLDLQYVENWSLGLDMTVLVKTVFAVIRSSGAY